MRGEDGRVGEGRVLLDEHYHRRVQQVGRAWSGFGLGFGFGFVLGLGRLLARAAGVARGPGH